MTDAAERLRKIKRFDQLVAYLRDELDWPVEDYPFEDLTFDWEPEELGIDWKTAAKIQEIKQLRPLATGQPWGIFFVKFEPKRLPVVALRRILGRLVLKKRATAAKSEMASWQLDDLLFISAYGEGDDRRISLAHFTEADHMGNLPCLRVLGFSEGDRDLKIDYVHREMQTKLHWPRDASQLDRWRKEWRSAFMLKHREVITTSKQLAFTLADLARDIRGRVNDILEIESEDGPLRKLMAAFREALIHDLTDDDFADMYAQTIAYGLLSARVSRTEGLVADDLVQMIPITNPFLKELMETFLDVGGKKRRSSAALDFDELGINEIVELLREANMEAVLRDFDNRNPQEDPVIHFYQDFLKEYDARKRMQRGVFYTPKPVVSYIVRSVHELLQTEFGLEHGLADTTTWGEMVARHTSTKRKRVSGDDTSTPRKQVSPAQPGDSDTLAGESCLYSDSGQPLTIPDGASPHQPFVQILDPATGTATFLVEVIDVIHLHLKSKWDEGGADAVPKIANHRSPLSDFTAYWNHYVPQCLLPRLHGYELMMAPYAIAHMKIGLKLAETGYRFQSDERVRVYLTNALEPWSKQLRLPDIEALAHEAQAVNDIKRVRRFTVILGNPPYSIVSQNAGAWITSIMDVYKEDVREERNIQPLSDDYLKFLRLGHFLVHNTGCGVLSLITNHTYLSGVIHRGVRRQLLSFFNGIEVLDLHGSALLGLTSPTGEPDQNVFDIQQGVCVATFVRGSGNGANNGLRRGDLWGLRNHKYQVLVGETDLPNFSPIDIVSPYYFFAKSTDADDAYKRGVSVAELFQRSTAGFVTGRDESLISFEKDQIVELVEDLSNGRLSDESIAYKYKMADTSGWPVTRRRKVVVRDTNRGTKIRRAAYRPFDDRFTFYCDFLQRSRYSVFRNLLRDNVALITSRLVKGEEPAHFFVSRLPVEKIFLSPKTSNNAFVFPLYAYAENDQIQGLKDSHVAIHPRVAQRIANSLGLTFDASRSEARCDDQVLRAEELLHYAYAVFYCPTYRTRYAEFLKIEFPRIPLTGNLILFRSLATLGGELVALHLMESPKLDEHITEFIGSGAAEVEKVSYSQETIWIDKAKRHGFRPVPEDVWQFHIGGYQVCQKWLKDRSPKKGQPGRLLTADDINHYHRIVVALSETIRLMTEIDETINQHGGWPDAFVTESTSLDE